VTTATFPFSDPLLFFPAERAILLRPWKKFETRDSGVARSTNIEDDAYQ
jgi:hypothetical protein